MTHIDKYNDNIPGWPGYYISKHGHLYTSKYVKDRWYRVRGHIHNGRLQVKLKDHGRSKQGGISRLVALAWVPNPKPEEYNVVMHLDNNPLNNYYKNLKWGTQGMNIQQAVCEGRFRGNTGPRPNSYGELNPNSKYRDRLVKRLYRYHLRHPKTPIKQLCLKFNTKPTWTYKILKGSVAILKDYTPY